MTVYPDQLDDDESLPRVSDNITETGQEVINALRDAIFAIQTALGTDPFKALSSVSNFLEISHNSDGTLKSSALTSVGLVTLPITNSQVGSNAGIDETKLNLAHTTTDLYTLISGNSALITSLTSFLNQTNTDLLLHISGAEKLSDSTTDNRHVASHIDLNNVPIDSRDGTYSWTGLFNKNGILRSSTTVAEALLEINDEFVDHQNTTSNAHVASSIVVDTDNFSEIPTSNTNVQKVLEYLDQSEVLNLGQHRATQHANAVAKISRSEVLNYDGYGAEIVPSTTVYTYLTHAPNTSPVDDLSVGDNVIKFVPTNTSFIFDSYFSQVKVGQIIRINYGNGLEASYPIESIRYTPDVEWIVRINGVNLCEVTDGSATARIDNSLDDRDTHGIFATAHANARDDSGVTYTNFLPSLIVSNPRAASVLGLGFDANQINSEHYKLYLQFYPSGNPTEKTILLPAIDISGDAGTNPGSYTLESVVESCNNEFRRIGYNFRFMAYQYAGEFGIKLTDCINNASFSIISGDNSSGTLSTGVYTNNVIGGNSLDSFDPLGLGTNGINFASPEYQSTWTDENAATLPTKIAVPLKKRYAIVNGIKLDDFASMYLANSDGYWDGYISEKNQISSSTIEVTYTVLHNLAPANLKAGKTITIQPTLEFTDSLYSDVDYGRFIIKSVNFIGACGTTPSQTQITVISGVHASEDPIPITADVGTAVKIYFYDDSVSFNNQNLIDESVGSYQYKRFMEVFVTDEGKTFAHERARMLVQAESSVNLNTSYLNLLDVSYKLRGYVDPSTKSLNKYIRLYVLNYNSTDGTFDGYLGKRDPLSNNVTKTGSITRGRKNIPVKFYDETNVDYVEILFKDNSIYPGLNLLSSSSPRYVDIELFNSLQTDDELFYVSSCQLTWGVLGNQNMIQYVTDRRQFGSVDETDFTDSAKNYISSISKYLNSNGVLFGFDLEEISSVTDSGEIFFTGGSCIVNGKIIACNNGSITIPQVYPQGTSLPQTLTWAICINEFGNFVAKILTTELEQYFVTNGSTTYYLDSITFNELIHNRKDLCLIALANVTIASLTVNSVSDARMFLFNENLSSALILSSDDFSGNFKEFSTLKQYLIYCSGKNNLVNLKGNFTLTESVDLTGLDNLVIFDGTNSTINFNPINNNSGILIDSNLHFKNWTINYSPSPSSTYDSSTSIINGFNGVFYSTNGNKNNITIENCIFNCDGYEQRPAFITFENNYGNTLENIRIINNNFNDLNTTSQTSETQSVILFNLSSGDSSLLCLYKNIFIKDNFVNKNQGCVQNCNVDDCNIALENFIISDNNFGYIAYGFGYLSSNYSDSNLVIKNNKSRLISNIFNKTFSTSRTTSPINNGMILIDGNYCNWIKSQVIDSDILYQHSSLNICNNTLKGYDPDFLSGFGITLNNYGIEILDTSDLVDGYSSDIIINNNNLNFSGDANNFGFSKGIACAMSSNITNNIIKGLNTSSIGIECSGISLEDKKYYVTGNKIFRFANSITNYIYLTNTSNVFNYVVDNIFDDYTIDGSTTNVINNSYGGVIRNNVNQTCTYKIPLNTGTFGIGIASYYLAGGSVPTNSYFTLDGVFTYANTGSEIRGNVHFPLYSIVPDGAKLIDVTLTYTPTAIPSVASLITLNVVTPISTFTDSDNPWVSGTNTITVSPNERITHRLTSESTNSSPYIQILLKAESVATANNVFSITVTFRY